MVYESQLLRHLRGCGRFALLTGIFLCGAALTGPLAAECPNAVWRPGQNELKLSGTWRFQAQPAAQGTSFEQDAAHHLYSLLYSLSN